MRRNVSRNRLTRRNIMQNVAIGAIAAKPVSALASQGAALGEIPALIESAIDAQSLRSVIVTVHDAAGEIYTSAWGESEVGNPARAEMYFRTGAVAITYAAYVLLSLADDGLLDIDEPIATWLPDLPDAETATPRMLIQMTAGYPDYVQSEAFTADFYQNPYRSFDAEELLDYGLAKPRTFAPGENWDYSHTNIVLLGKVLERATGQSLSDLMLERVFEPLDLQHTFASELPAMATPTLHAYSSERRVALGIEADVPFYEETTTWNPSWTLAPGGVQYSTIGDVASSFRQIGQGVGLSKSSHDQLTSDSLIGFGNLLDGCPNCHTLDSVYSYGLGIVISNGWYLQNPLFGGYGATVATLPDAGFTIAVAVTFAEDAFDDNGDYAFGNSSQTLVNQISNVLVPDQPMLLG